MKKDELLAKIDAAFERDGNISKDEACARVLDVLCERRSNLLDLQVRVKACAFDADMEEFEEELEAVLNGTWLRSEDELAEIARKAREARTEGEIERQAREAARTLSESAKVDGTGRCGFKQLSAGGKGIHVCRRENGHEGQHFSGPAAKMPEETGTPCGECQEEIPFGKSAWFDKTKKHWVCDACRYGERPPLSEAEIAELAKAASSGPYRSLGRDMNSEEEDEFLRSLAGLGPISREAKKAAFLRQLAARGLRDAFYVKPVRTRRSALTFHAVEVQPGATVHVIAMPQVAFRPTQFVVEVASQADFVINDIILGNMSMLANADGPVPGTFFPRIPDRSKFSKEDFERVERLLSIDWPTVNVSQQVRVQATNVGSGSRGDRGPRTLRVTMAGLIMDCP